MISVTFTADVENIVATEHLYQWDNGQKLSISGVGTTADIHFANKKSEKALVVTPTVTSGAMEAPIPNSLLAEPYPIIAYVYVPSDDGARTLKTVTIAVEARKQPSDFVLDEDEGITTLESISQRVNEMIQSATNQINTAVSNMQTDYGNFKTTIQSELADMVANTTIPNADTVDGHHASDFALKTDIPSTLPANGGTADKVNSLHGGIHYTDNRDIFSATLSNDNPCWNRWVSIMGTTHDPSYSQYIPNSPDGEIAGGVWYEVLTGGVSDRAFQLVIGCYVHQRKVFIRYKHDSGWSPWKNIADGGNADTANTAGTLATTASNVCLRNISFGTAEPQVTDPSAEGYVAEGALYGQYEEVTT